MNDYQLLKELLDPTTTFAEADRLSPRTPPADTTHEPPAEEPEDPDDVSSP